MSKKLKISLFREIYGKMSSIVDRRTFAVRFAGFEAIEEVIMPIRIRCVTRRQSRYNTLI